MKFWKTIEKVSRYRPKDSIFKTLCSYAKNYVHEVKNSIKSSKIVKNCQKLPSNRQKWKCLKKHFFCSFYVIMSIHAKNCVCRRRMGWLVANTKTKRKKLKKNALKTSKIKISKNRGEKSHSPNEHISKKNRFLGWKLWPVACWQTNAHTDKKQRQREALSGLSELPPFSPSSNQKSKLTPNIVKNENFIT